MPNPAVEKTVIPYELSRSSNVIFEVYDITGKMVLEFDEGTVPAGVHSIKINTNNLNSGVYYYTLRADDVKLTRKMVNIK